MSESLAVKYRPKTFDEVTSQTSIIKILKRQIELRNFKNSYIFAGASGCGKTTTARIFANAINNNQGEPIEIDAASTNGVEKVKQIVSTAGERSLHSEYKVYILDECHVYSAQSWQAFLKCIEEPPKYTIFIFCTTDPQKIPDTISNRCMRFNFTRIDSDHIYNRLKYICEQEGFTNYEDSISYISKISKGQMRDAVSLLEKVTAFDTNLDIESTVEFLGNYSYQTFFTLANAILDGDEKLVVTILDDFYLQGGDLYQFVEQFLSFNLDILKYNLLKELSILQIPVAFEPELKSITSISNASEYFSYIIENLLALKFKLGGDTSPKTTIEIYLLKITRCK